MTAAAPLDETAGSTEIDEYEELALDLDHLAMVLDCPSDHYLFKAAKIIHDRSARPEEVLAEACDLLRTVQENVRPVDLAYNDLDGAITDFLNKHSMNKGKG